MFIYNGKKIITCELETPENNYNYLYSRIHGDDWDELEDPCADCGYRTYKEVEIEENESN